MKSEDDAIKRVLKPILEGVYFIKTSVRVDRLHSKLRTEGALTSEEINIKHPFHPDIDILFWAKEYSGEPAIVASEVKYFRLRKGAVYPNLYEGLGEALMLLTYGADYVCLWHLFDPEIPSETVSRYRDWTQSLVTEAYSPINYQSWLLPEIMERPLEQKATPKDLWTINLERILEGFQRIFLPYSIMQNLKPNPIRNRWDTKIMRSIIKKRFRIVNK